MLKGLVRQPLSRLRGFMQAEIVAELHLTRGQIAGLNGELQRLNTEHERLRAEHEALGATLHGLHGEQEQLRTTLRQLQAALDQLDQTAGAVEKGLLSLALLRDR